MRIITGHDECKARLPATFSREGLEFSSKCRKTGMVQAYREGGHCGVGCCRAAAVADLLCREQR